MLSKRQAESLIVVVTFIAAFGWICSKEAILGLPPIGFMGVRFLLASLIILPWSLKSITQISFKQFNKSIILGLLMTSNLILWIYGVATTSSLGEGAFIVSLSMLFVPLVTFLVIRVKPSNAFWIALPIALVGLIFLSLLKSNIHFELSHIFFLLSAIAQAFYFFYAGLYARDIPLMALTTLQLAVTGIISLMLSYLFEEWPSFVSNETLGWLAASVVIATTLRFALQLVAQKYASTENASIIMINEPVLVFILGVVWYDAPISLLQVLGCILILFALFYYRFAQRKV